VGWYKSSKGGWQMEGSPQVTTADDLAESINKPTVICGELSGEERQRLARKRVNVQLVSPIAGLRRPSVLAGLAWERWQAKEVDELSSLAPIYLHVAEPIPS
jgi:tRNA threonylcarbamoyladenosine biosynthesis protein TsaB